jgi:hypothetical protein
MRFSEKEFNGIINIIAIAMMMFLQKHKNLFQDHLSLVNSQIQYFSEGFCYTPIEAGITGI